MSDSKYKVGALLRRAEYERMGTARLAQMDQLVEHAKLLGFEITVRDTTRQVVKSTSDPCLACGATNWWVTSGFAQVLHIKCGDCGIEETILD